jgi:NAD(P)-dependent dehydrogenase (short-subunit alcohol dehydrogenase family)
MRIPGKVAIVTAGAGRIGQAISRRLAAEGAAVTVNDINAERAEAIAEEIRQAGGQALAWPADVSKSDEVRAMVAGTIEAFGGLDILVNNAGGSAGLLKRLTLFEHADEEVCDWVVNLNLKGTMVCSQAVLAPMIERGGGKIVNMGSIAGTVGIIERVDYSAAKGGIIAFTAALAMEVGHHGISVNCISPGSIVPPPADDENANYLGRYGRPDDVASLALFLASDEASYITGQNIIIDGGRALGPKTQALNKLPPLKRKGDAQ